MARGCGTCCNRKKHIGNPVDPGGTSALFWGQACGGVVQQNGAPGEIRGGDPGIRCLPRTPAVMKRNQLSPNIIEISDD